MRTCSASVATLALCLAAAPLAIRDAQATEGYFLGGFGATQTGLAGAGVANSTDAMSLSLNPAGLVDVGQQFNLGLSFFSPSRGYDATGTPAFVAPGSHTSAGSLYVIPNIAYSQPIDGASAWGVAMYGSGGNSTMYKGVTGGPACPLPNMGVYCGGWAGVNLNQMFVEAGYARSFGAVSVGVAPVFALQMFNAVGLGAFGPLSSDGANLTNNGVDTSVGFGVHAGAEWKVTPSFRIGLAGATPTWMSKFSNYQGLFAGQGSFDIPASITAGVAFDVSSAFTVMADYKHIFYASIPALGDSSSTPRPFGSTGGPGFGWHDVDVFAIGGEWRATPDLTLRAGYEYNTNPIKAADVTLNILAPGVTVQQFSAGLSYRFSKNSTFDLAGYYAPQNSVSGPQFVPPPFGAGPVPGSNIKIHLSEAQVTLGWTYHFDAMAPGAPVVAKY